MIISFSKLGGGSGSVPIATRETAGIVKVGSGLDIDSGGTLSNSGSLPVYDYYVLNNDSIARTELIDIVSGGTQAAAISKDGTLYYYKGYDDDYGRYAFIDPKVSYFNEGSGGGVNFMFYNAVLLNSDDAMTENYGTHCNLQEYCYTTNEYAKHDIQTNGILYSKVNIYDILAGSTPVIGETYNTIYFTVPGMLWWDNSMSVIVPGVNGGQPFDISWWSDEAWNVNGEIYDNQTTTVSGLTVDFSHVIGGDIGYISVSCPLGMTVNDIPNGGEGGGTSISEPVKASANLEIYRSGEWNSISPLPNLIYSGVSDGELTSIMTKVRTNLYNGAYAGTERFYLLYNGLSQTVLSFGYSAVSGVSETLILKAIDYSAVIGHDIQNSTYTLDISANANLWIGTQQEYNLLPSYDDNTLYVIRKPQVPADELWYTTSNGMVTQMDDSYLQDVTVASNTYVDGQGVIKFSGPLLTIPDDAFFNNSDITSVEISNYADVIRGNAFTNCTSLESVAIGSGMTGMYDNPFMDCPALSSITVSQGNQYLSDGGGSNCIIDIYNGLNLLATGCKTTVIPDFVERIGERAFQGCSGLSAITIPSSVTIIADYAFYGCQNLSTINYNGTMNEWGNMQYIGMSWHDYVPATEIHCTDGDIPL